ncbi:MAG: hypothetical protein OEV30_07940 [Ignavibacteria bacterium]|nr:hypothetical protein [Ignavibacteria bacterium]
MNTIIRALSLLLAAQMVLSVAYPHFADNPFRACSQHSWVEGEEIPTLFSLLPPRDVRTGCSDGPITSIPPCTMTDDELRADSFSSLLLHERCLPLPATLVYTLTTTSRL